MIEQHGSKNSSLYSNFKNWLAEEYIYMFKTFNFHFHVLSYLLTEFSVIVQHTHTACSNLIHPPLIDRPQTPVISVLYSSQLHRVFVFLCMACLFHLTRSVHPTADGRIALYFQISVVDTCHIFCIHPFVGGP